MKNVSLEVSGQALIRCKPAPASALDHAHIIDKVSQPPRAGGRPAKKKGVTNLRREPEVVLIIVNIPDLPVRDVIEVGPSGPPIPFALFELVSHALDFVV